MYFGGVTGIWSHRPAPVSQVQYSTNWATLSAFFALDFIF
jgi:hypothetical protein